MRRQFRFFYKDGVYAQDIIFTDKSEKFIKAYLQREIKRFNTCPNSLYHIDFSDIKEVKRVRTQRQLRTS